MRILIVEPFKRPYPADIEGSLESMQAVVGGLIEPIFIFEEPVALVCNEEGKLMNLPFNRPIFDDKGRIADIIAGTFFLCYAPPDGDSFVSLTDEQIGYYTRFFGGGGCSA